MSEETQTEAKAEEAKKETKHKVPATHVAPVEATHRLKKTVNPATGEPYIPESFTTQQMYTMLRAAESNGMPVKHFHKDGSIHDKEIKDESGEKLTRPGFDFDELTAWWGNRPARKTKATKAEGGEKSESAPAEGLSEEEELAEGDDGLVEAE